MGFPGLPRRKTFRRTAPSLQLTPLEDRTVPAAVAATNPTGILDFGFESVKLAAKTFRYGPAGSAWVFTGSAGVSANGSGFTAGNPAAPQGSQAGFLQNKSTATETVNLAAGSYTLGFSAAERVNKASNETFLVTVDGKVVGSFNNLSGGAYQSLSTSSFTVTAGNHTISFQGTNAYGGDNTVFLDQVTLTQQPTSLADSGFEAPAIAAGAFKYNPTGGAWIYSGGAGVTENNSAFTAGNPAAPQGSQVVFLQNSGGIRQAVTFAAGTYTVSFNAAQRGNGGGNQTFQVLIDGKVVGTFNNFSGTGYTTLTTSSFTVTAGTHTLAIQATNLNGGDNTVFIDQVAVTQQPTSLADSGFEGIVVPGGGFQYDPTGSPWSFSGGAGISSNGSGFTSGNPTAPQGSQVVFLQNISGISQAVTFAAGTYTISLNAAQRGNIASAQTLQVLVDGNVVGTFNNLTGTGYSTLTTSGFAVTAGSHVVTIQGTDVNGGDNTALIDQVAITQLTTGLTDLGFEQLPLGAGGYTYDPEGSAWSFAGTAGVAGNGSAFTSSNPAAPEGSQVAFLQQTGSVSQSMTFAAGTYALSFRAAQRGNGGGSQTFQVLVDGNVVGTFNNLTGTGFGTLSTGAFTVAAGSHTVTFQGTNLNGGDNTVLIDQVAIVSQATSLADTSFETAAVAPGGFVYGPTGTPWAFVGGAGIASNGSPFTSGNPNSPNGSQVLFLQNVGGVSQTATFPAGTYTINLSAAARANGGGNQTVKVLVDGTVVGTFAVKGSAYTTWTTASFTLAAGSHIITIQGTSKTGDNTAFIDQVTVNPQ
jgi:hypothetical protein